MVKKQTAPLLLKIFFVLIFSGLLVYWAWAAIDKYINQPVSTFVSYSQGDDNTHVILPYVTFCDTNFIGDDKVLQACNNPLDSVSTKLYGQDTNKKELIFLSIIRNCLNNGINFSMNDYLKSLEETRLNDFIIDHYMTETTFNRSFYAKYDLTHGLCIAFDAREVEMKVDDADTDLFLKLNIQSIREESSILAMLHTRTDYPDACSLHSCFNLKKGFFHYMSLKKSIISRDSTRKSECTQYNKRTCKEIKSNRIIMDNFKCKVMFLDTGTHLEHYIEGYVDLPICSNSSVMKEAIDIVENTMDDDDECNKVVSCQRTKFDAYTSGELGGELARTYFWLKFQDIEVEHFVTYISYDTQNLICELGGVLGMFLGLSGVSIGYYFVEMTERHFLHEKSPLCKSLMRRFRRLRRRSGKNVKNGKTIWMIISAFSIALLVLLIFLATILPSVNEKSHHLTTTMSSTVLPTTSTTFTNGRTCYTGYEDKASFIFSLNGHCYYAENELKSFDLALANCKALFGLEAFLAEPKNPDENYDLHDWAVDYLTDQFYIGVTDIQFEGSFTYQSSGQPISYQNWANSEPSDSNNNEDCVEMISYAEWNDIPCSIARASVCQYNTSSPPPTTLKPGTVDPGLAGCDKPGWVGDGFCDDLTNNIDCEMDGGDCCLPDPVTTYCSVCQCHDNGCEAKGGVLVWVFDGYCDDLNNIPECDHDGGDCCLEQINTDYCDQCECLNEDTSSTAANHDATTTLSTQGCPGEPSWIGDGLCDDLNNIPECDHDGGDCCLEQTNTDYCEQCECIEN